MQVIFHINFGRLNKEKTNWLRENLLEITSMKLITTLILAGLACILVLAAGCTNTPSTPAITTTPTTVVTTVPTAAAPVLSWTGTWNTTWAEDVNWSVDVIRITQTGSSVTGIYEVGNGTISGNVTGSSLTGVWSEIDGEDVYEGTFEFVMSDDKKSFTGKWANTGEDLANSTYPWNGVRV